MMDAHDHPLPNYRDTRSHIDDIAMEWAFNKRSNNRLTHTVIRAAHPVAVTIREMAHHMGPQGGQNEGATMDRRPDPQRFHLILGSTPTLT